MSSVLILTNFIFMKPFCSSFVLKAWYLLQWGMWCEICRWQSGKRFQMYLFMEGVEHCSLFNELEKQFLFKYILLNPFLTLKLFVHSLVAVRQEPKASPRHWFETLQKIWKHVSTWVFQKISLYYVIVAFYGKVCEATSYYQ